MRSTYKKKKQANMYFSSNPKRKTRKTDNRRFTKNHFFCEKNEQEFIDMVSKQAIQENEKFLKTSKKEFKVSLARIDMLDTTIICLYENNVEGKVSTERFKNLQIHMKLNKQYLP